MEIILQGNLYGYKIVAIRTGRRYNFYVKAVHKKSRRSSYITNINLLLGELNVDLEDSRFWESEWDVSKKEMKKFISETKNLLLSKKYLPYFENFLNEDRDAGEWENRNF